MHSYNIPWSESYPNQKYNMWCMISNCTNRWLVSITYDALQHPRVFPIRTSNIGHISIPSCTTSHLHSRHRQKENVTSMISKNFRTSNWPRLNHVRYISKPKVSVPSAQEMLDPSVHYPILCHHLVRSLVQHKVMICHVYIQGASVHVPANNCVPITRGPTESFLSAYEILDTSAHYPILYHPSIWSTA